MRAAAAAAIAGVAAALSNSNGTLSALQTALNNAAQSSAELGSSPLLDSLSTSGFLDAYTAATGVNPADLATALTVSEPTVRVPSVTGTATPSMTGTNVPAPVAGTPPPTLSATNPSVVLPAAATPSLTASLTATASPEPRLTGTPPRFDPAVVGVSATAGVMLLCMLCSCAYFWLGRWDEYRRRRRGLPEVVPEAGGNPPSQCGLPAGAEEDPPPQMEPPADAGDPSPPPPGLPADAVDPPSKGDASAPEPEVV